MTTYHLLGPLRVERAGTPVDLGGRKQRAVLAALLLEAGRVVSTDRLVSVLWGERSQERASGNLQAYVSHLRRLLRDENGATSPIVRRPPGYLLDVDPATVDVTEFVHLSDTARGRVREGDWTGAVEAGQCALALWRGPVLADLDDEEWVRTAAAPLEERRLACERDLVTGLLGDDRIAEALGLARRLSSEHPLDEHVWWLYAVSLHRAGRTADALSVLRAFHDLLADELGIDPGTAIRDLQGSLLRQDPDLDHWPHHGRDQQTTDVVEPADIELVTPPSLTAAVSDPIIGRAAELVEIDDAWTAALQGRSPWVLLTGEPGIGKTRLAHEAEQRWRALADGDVTSVLSTVCPDDGGTPSWWPLRGLVRELGAEPDDVLRTPGDLDADAARFVVYDAVADLLRRRAAERPTLIRIEDAQWADAATFALFTHLATTLDAPGLAFLVTLRQDFADGAGAPLRAAALRRSVARSLALPPLSADEVAELVSQVSGQEIPPEQLIDLTTRTAGNPFFVSEYARLPAADGPEQIPPGVRLVLERRLAALPEPVLELLMTAAVIGEQVDVDLLRTVVGLEIDELAERLDIAADESVLKPDRSAGYSFLHALLREQLLASMRPSRRQAVHRRIADALAGLDDPRSLSARAVHLVAAGPFAEATDAVEACRIAARDAENRWDPDEAARWWEQALEIHDARVRTGSTVRDELVVGLAEAWVRGGHGQRMLDLVESSLDGAWHDDRRQSVGGFAALLSRLTGAWPWIAYGTDPGPLLSRLAAMTPHLENDPATHARVLAALAIGNCYHLDPVVPDHLSQRAIDLAETTKDTAVVADALLGRAMTYAGVAHRSQESLDLLDRLVRLEQPHADLDRVIAHGVASMATMNLADLEASRAHVRDGMAEAERMHLPVNLAQLRWAQGSLRLWTTQDVAAFGAEHDAARAVHVHTELTQSVTVILATLTLRWEQGLLHEGLEVDNPFLAPWITAITAAARNAPEAATLLAEQVQRPEPASWTSHGRMTLLAHALADLGLVDLVDTAVQQLLPAADQLASMGHVGIVGPVGLALSRLEATRGDLDAARGHLAVAARLCQASGGENSLLRCHLQGFTLDLLAGDRPSSQAVADLADQAARRGLGGVARSARALLLG